MHDTTVNTPLVKHSAFPPPLYPSMHVTATISPVTPVIFPVPALSEFATSVAMQGLGVQVNTVPSKTPAAHV